MNSRGTLLNRKSVTMSFHCIDFKDRYTVVDQSVAVLADVMGEAVSHSISYGKRISDNKVWMPFTSVHSCID